MRTQRTTVVGCQADTSDTILLHSWLSCQLDALIGTMVALPVAVNYC